LDSQTDDDGKKLAVHGSTRGDGFEVKGPHGDATLPACVKSFAYWEESFVTESRALRDRFVVPS
jgi:hypothetical protein